MRDTALLRRRRVARAVVVVAIAVAVQLRLVEFQLQSGGCSPGGSCCINMNGVLCLLLDESGGIGEGELRARALHLECLPVLRARFPCTLRGSPRACELAAQQSDLREQLGGGRGRWIGEHLVQGPAQRGDLRLQALRLLCLRQLDGATQLPERVRSAEVSSSTSCTLWTSVGEKLTAFGEASGDDDGGGDGGVGVDAALTQVLWSASAAPRDVRATAA